MAPPQQRKFLGFGFSDGPEVKRIIAPNALDRFKHRVREITRRAKGVIIDATIAELAPYNLAKLFRILRNARSADLPHSLGPFETSSGFVAAVENTTPSLRSIVGTGCSSTPGP